MENYFERIKPAFWIIGAVMFGLGLFGWYSRLAHGHADAGYGNIVVWGLWVATYIHTALGTLAKGRGTSDSTLRPAVSDPLSGQALHKEACVRVRKA
jgi:hypothetical protein